MKWVLLILVISFAYSNAQAQNKFVSQSAKKNHILVEPSSPAPSFPGGKKPFYKFLSKNLKYPEEDRETYGTVIISFFVETDGLLTGIKVAKSLSPDLDAEALRVIKKSPKWIPAMKNHKPVKVEYKVPINFIFSE